MVSGWSRRIVYTTAALLALIAFSRLWSAGINEPPHPDIPLAEAHLHLVLTAPSSSIHLCKFLLTASVLGYPTPTIINWGKSYSAQGSGRHLEKLRGVITFLDGLKYENRRDLVIVVDALDTWFQLRPSTLIERYHTINRAAHTRLGAQTGMSRAMKAKNIRQSVIFSASKQCSAAPESPYCFLQPEATTAADMYGSATDILDAAGQPTHVRPRFLNEGFVIGEAADLRAVLARAFERIDPSLSDAEQSPLSAVFAEQTLMREIWRRTHVSELDDVAESLHDKIATPRARSEYQRMLSAAAAHPDASLFHMHDAHANGELHVGIDYGSLLSHSTSWSERDFQYLAYNATPPLPIHSTSRENLPTDCIPASPAELPPDISSARAPISDRLELPNLPHPLPSWHDLPLYTAVCAGAVPVSIHHDGDKRTIEAEWPHLWIQPFAAPLRLGQARLALLSLQAEGPAVNDGGALLDDGRKLEWDELCENQLWGNELYDGRPFGGVPGDPAGVARPPV